jgi:putative NADH-flavin reductase
MKLLVLGATGGIGLEIVRQAVARHHSVTAFVRSPERLAAFQGRIALEQGDLLCTSELERAIQGNDAILSGFGPRLPLVKADANLLRDFASALTSAMRRASVYRLVIVSTAFLFRGLDPAANLSGR